MEFTCELDEYAQLVKDLKESGIVKDHRHLVKTYKNSFIGREAVDWLVKSKGVGRDCNISIANIFIFLIGVKSDVILIDMKSIQSVSFFN